MNKLKLHLSKLQILSITILSILVFFYWQSLPSPLFNRPVSTIAFDADNYLIGAKIAKDEQWRFSPADTVPEKIAICLTQFEDKRFFSHWGVDVRAFGRAIYQNIKYRKIVSGGSTISMQVIRLMRDGKSRTFSEKFIEMLLAFRLELGYSKQEILRLYASNAPMGGNIVGIDAAAWKYFQTPANNLSWAQAATLAILPNSPALIHPGKNRNRLKQKRNFLLKRLFDKKIIDAETYELAVEEELPKKAKAIEQHSTQLLNLLDTKYAKSTNAVHYTSIQLHLQNQIENILRRRKPYLNSNQIKNAAVLVANVHTGKVMAYVANMPEADAASSNRVDLIQADRSTGSVLKPFLYASMLQDGLILPHSMVPDIPIQFGGFMPKNYNRNYEGAVNADRALARSLNIPAVFMLKEFGVEKFQSKLQQLGMTSLTEAPQHYGLSLILGGSEASLWELVGIYASLGRILNNYPVHNGKYFAEDIHELTVENDDINQEYKKELANPVLDAASIYYTFQAMLKVERPTNENSWESYSSASPIAWKTGTSFGFRDAWSIGLNTDYVVGVWVGNADGEGRPDLIGMNVAAPVLFDVFRLLPFSTEWFEKPYDELIPIATCHQTGFLAGPYCNDVDTLLLSPAAEKSSVCPYHKHINLDKTEKFQVTSNCANPAEMVAHNWFILPPVMEYYYKKVHPEYKALPPFLTNCKGLNNNSGHRIESIYPQNGTKVYIPLDWNSKHTKLIFKAAHQNDKAELFWYIDDKLIAKTKETHEIEVYLKPGKYNLLLLDNFGESINVHFEVESKDKASY
jgi:penicillin-binding protein 1C